MFFLSSGSMISMLFLIVRHFIDRLPLFLGLDCTVYTPLLLASSWSARAAYNLASPR